MEDFLITGLQGILYPAITDESIKFTKLTDMKKIILSLAICLPLWMGCNNNPKETGDKNGHEHEHGTGEGQHTHDGEHIYSCPMHPEVTSNKPGDCPKCGMALEHTDKAADNKKYVMDYKFSPETIEAGKEAEMSFTPRDEADKSVPVPLDVVHEKKIHLIIVSKDLSYFEHIHPEYNADGSYKIKVLKDKKSYSKGEGHDETSFQHGGDYVLFMDYSPAGSGHKLARIPLRVEGKERPAVRYTNQNMTWTGDGYKVDLSADKELKTGQLTGLKVAVTRNGKPVTNLDKYLGALGHMVVIHENTEEYLHVHPNDSDGRGPDITFHSSFEKPGIYRVFLQFNHEGRIRTADFTIKVS